MKNLTFLLSFLMLLPYSYSRNKINYTDPLPGANYVSTGNNIVIGFEKQITLNETEIANCISVTGSKSIRLGGTIVICSGKKKIIFKPSAPFQEGEKINVKLSGKLLQALNTERKEYEYFFNISPGKPRPETFENPANEFDIIPNFSGGEQLSDPPLLSVTVNNNPSEGYIFIAPYSSATFLIITDKNGSTYWYNQTHRWCGDFKKTL